MLAQTRNYRVCIGKDKQGILCAFAMMQFDHLRVLRQMTHLHETWVKNAGFQTEVVNTNQPALRP